MRLTWIQDAIKDPAKNVLATIVVTTFGLGILTNGVSGLLLEGGGGWLERQYGVPKVGFQGAVVLGLAGLLLGGIYLTSMADWVGRLLGDGVERVSRANVEPLSWGFPGLVTAVSMRAPGNTQMTPAEVAVRFHWERGTLRHCWLICTQKSESEAAGIVERLEAEGAPRGIFHYGEQHTLWQPDGTVVPLSLLLTADQMDDPNHVRQVVDRIYGEAEGLFGMQETELVVDYTGGTKSMTAGMMLACVSPRRQVEYFSQILGQLMLVRTAYVLKEESRKAER